MERAELKSFVRQLGCAVTRGGWTFLCDPGWSEADRSDVNRLLVRAETGSPPEQGWLCIRTGGSSGGLKFARHDELTLGVAVSGFQRHFGMSVINAVGVLPPWHISGLMARLRCVATGGRYVDCEWKTLERGEFPALPSSSASAHAGDGGSANWVLSLVPTQLHRLLASAAAVAWLRQFRVIFLGGGPTWPELADAAARAQLPISLSYGMTETAAMVTAQQPAEFLAGDRSSGTPLPHASVQLGTDDRVVVAGESLFRGYFPEIRAADAFITADFGRIDEHGRLHLLGRSDTVIISGGKKIHPTEIEAALRASGEFEDVIVLGLPDAEWGEIVVACYPAASRPPDCAKAMITLAAYERPKRFVPLANWPRNAQGKINRLELRTQVAALAGRAL
jgi:O-succinylbenzoic acid--CoA ligase